MPRFLSSAVHTEGRTDDRFLTVVASRTLERHCIRNATAQVDVAEPILLDDLIRTRRRYSDICDAAEAASDFVDLLLLHHDGAGDAEGVRQRWIAPMAERLAQRGLRLEVIGIVPVREMEAWALADGDAIRRVLGSTLSDGSLGIPARPADVETIADPKRALQDAVERGIGTTRGPRSRAARYLDLLAAEVSLERLGLVPSYARFATDLHMALERLGVYR